MTPEEKTFRAALGERLVIKKLQDSGLWAGDGPPRVVDGVKGFTLGDLYRFCTYAVAPGAIEQGQERRRNWSAIIDAANKISAAMKALRQLKRMGLDWRQWFWCLAFRSQGRFEPPLVTGDVEGGFEAFCDYLKVVAKAEKADVHRPPLPEQEFVRLWSEFANIRAETPLHEIGAALFEITFAREMDAAKFRKRRGRVPEPTAGHLTAKN